MNERKKKNQKYRGYQIKLKLLRVATFFQNWLIFPFLLRATFRFGISIYYNLCCRRRSSSVTLLSASFEHLIISQPLDGTDSYMV